MSKRKFRLTILMPISHSSSRPPTIARAVAAAPQKPRIYVNPKSCKAGYLKSPHLQVDEDGVNACSLNPESLVLRTPAFTIENRPKEQRKPLFGKLLLMDQRTSICHYANVSWPLGLIAVLLLTGCSPLHLVNSLSTEMDSTTVAHRRYGLEKRHQLDIFMPEKVVTGSPVVVFFYGGSWKRGEKGNYAFVGHSLSRKGYITVIPDYRLYPQVTFPSFVEDGALAVAWVNEHVEQARNGVVVMGHSAGAHTAALLALDQRYLEAAGQPSSTISGLIGLAGPYGFNPLEYRSTRPIFADVDVIDTAKPVSFACSAHPALLLLHGSEDHVVIPENSIELKRRARACTGNVNYIELDHTGHFSILLGLSDSFLAKETVQSSIDRFLQSLSQQSG